MAGSTVPVSSSCVQTPGPKQPFPASRFKKQAANLDQSVFVRLIVGRRVVMVHHASRRRRPILQAINDGPLIDTANSAPPLPSPERLQELLFDAARLGRDDIIPSLLQAGAEIEGQDGRGYTALVLASYNGHKSTTVLLLSLGARPDGTVASRGNNALMGVAFKGYTTIAKILLAAGADANFANTAGQTALMMAALFDRREIIDLLLASAADPRLRDAAGNTAASVAEAQGNEGLALFLQQLLPLETMPPSRPVKNPGS